MVLTPLMDKEIGVRVPEDIPPEQITDPPPPDLTQVLFKVDEAGMFHINNETLTDANLGDRLKAYYRLAKSKEATQGPPVIFFDADDKAKYVRAIKGLDAIRDSSSGWTIGMMTSSIKAETAAPAAETPAAPGATPGAAPAAPATPAEPPK
jgi:biopolymer transport protein TolR